MKKYVPGASIFVCCCLVFASCNTATPEKYFDLAVLNTNMLTGFADDGEARQFESPSAKMDDKGQAVAMKRSEVIDTKLKFLEEDVKKLKGLKETPDTREMLQTSLSVYEYVLPVYKTEYVQLARLYDEGASKETIEAHVKTIHEKYFPRYSELLARLISIGKIYAERHSIKVNWGL